MNAKDLAYAAGRGGTPPTGVSGALKALCLARAGRWDEAHEECKKKEGDPELAWVHAHLHRVKGELDNASHWYVIAQKKQPGGQSGLGEEWMEIAETLLSAP